MRGQLLLLGASNFCGEPVTFQIFDISDVTNSVLKLFYYRQFSFNDFSSVALLYWSNYMNCAYGKVANEGAKMEYCYFSVL